MNIDTEMVINKHGKFKKYEAKVDFTLPVLETKPD